MKKDIEFNCNINGSSTDYSEYGIHSFEIRQLLQESFNEIIADILAKNNDNTIQIDVVVRTK